MKYKAVMATVLLCANLGVPLSAKQQPAQNAQANPKEVKVLVVYYSQTGNTEKMARAVAEGAKKIAGVTALAKKVADVSGEDLKTADAILLGSPTYYGDLAGQMKSFIDDWFFKFKVALVDKVGGAFSSGQGETGGKEHVLYSLIIAMMNAGMITAGPLLEGFGTVGVSALDPVNESALKECRALGEHVANVARRVKTGESRK
jgi:NAD(P)H dehydrogenase (quinone)